MLVATRLWLCGKLAPKGFSVVPDEGELGMLGRIRKRSQYEMENIARGDAVRSLAARFLAHRGSELSLADLRCPESVSRYHEAMMLPRLRRLVRDKAVGCRHELFSQILRAFHENWPADLEWPADVPRPLDPAPKRKRRAA